MDAKVKPQDQSETDEQTGTSTHQQRQETRDVITPYAFGVASELFGTPLATPFRRAVALSVDLFLVAILSGVTGNALAILVAVLLWVTSRRLKREKRLPSVIILVRLLAVFLIVAGIFGLFRNDTAIWSGDPNSTNTKVQAADAVKVVVFTGRYAALVSIIPKQLEEGECLDLASCWLLLGSDFVEDLVELALPKADKAEMLEEFLEQSEDDFEAAAFAEFSTSLLASFESKQTEKEIVIAENEAKATEEAKSESESFQDYSIVKWFKGIAADLGVGFGWAAVYFTGTMVLLRGQTVGKKLLRIKVIKLDGSSLNVWESFGRYGGYGAGLATGLLGFLQIYWDPNRQAIQDKISETLVIRLKAK